jgi:hypothetical protein
MEPNEALEAMKLRKDQAYEGDVRLPEHGNQTWDEINEYWLRHKRKYQKLLENPDGL